MNESSPLRKWLDEVEKTGEIPKPPVSDPNPELENLAHKPRSSKKENEPKKVPGEERETDATWDKLPIRDANEWWHN